MYIGVGASLALGCGERAADTITIQDEVIEPSGEYPLITLGNLPTQTTVVVEEIPYISDITSTAATPPSAINEGAEAIIPAAVPTIEVIDKGAEAVEPATRVSPPEQETTTTQEPAPYIEHYDRWVALSECESGGNWSINTGNGYYGGLQFSKSSWIGAGGLQFATRADYATAMQQMLTAEVLLDMQGWKAWPACSRKLGYR